MPDFPDISHHNPTPDFRAIKAAGAPLVILKATEGSSYTDPTFRSRWAAAKAAGLLRGAYHFARPGTDPERAADGLYAIASDAELPLVLDWEDAGVSTEWAERFLRRLDARSGKVSIVYTTASFARSHAGSSRLTHWPLWVARYNRTLGSIAPWTSAFAWQFTDHGRIDGFVGDVSHLYRLPLTTPKADNAGVRPSDSHEKIKFFQVLLNLAGQKVAVDGVFGKGTGQAVRNLKAFFNAKHVGGHTFDLSKERGWQGGPEFMHVLVDWINFLKSLGKF